MIYIYSQSITMARESENSGTYLKPPPQSHLDESNVKEVFSNVPEQNTYLS